MKLLIGLGFTLGIVPIFHFPFPQFSNIPLVNRVFHLPFYARASERTKFPWEYHLVLSNQVTISFRKAVSSQPNVTGKTEGDGEKVTGQQIINMESFHIDDREDFKDESLYTFCGSCKNHVMTTVTYRVGKMTIVFAAALCLLGCFGGCCLFRFYGNDFKMWSMCVQTAS